MTWSDYKAERCNVTTHLDHPDWDATDYPWEFVRSDGIITVHKTNSPFGGPDSQQRGVEWSMRLADKHLPLGQEDQWPLKPDGWGEVDYDRLEELERAEDDRDATAVNTLNAAHLADQRILERARSMPDVTPALRAAATYPAPEGRTSWED